MEDVEWKCTACGYTCRLPVGASLGWHYLPGFNRGAENVCTGETKRAEQMTDTQVRLVAALLTDEEHEALEWVRQEFAELCYDDDPRYIDALDTLDRLLEKP